MLFKKDDIHVGDLVLVGRERKPVRVSRLVEAGRFGTYRFVGRNDLTGREIRFTAAKVRAKA